MSAANVAKAARTAERAGWKNIVVEEVAVQDKAVHTRKSTPARTPAEARPAQAEERAPLALYSVRPAAGGGLDVVNNSGLVVSGDWQTEAGAQERAESALTQTQRRVYAVVKRDGAIGAGYARNLTAVRSLHAASPIKLTEYGPAPGTPSMFRCPPPTRPRPSRPPVRAYCPRTPNIRRSPPG